MMDGEILSTYRGSATLSYDAFRTSYFARGQLIGWAFGRGRPLVVGLIPYSIANDLSDPEWHALHRLTIPGMLFKEGRRAMQNSLCEY